VVSPEHGIHSFPSEQHHLLKTVTVGTEFCA
jgi:hypothetical protein